MALFYVPPRAIPRRPFAPECGKEGFRACVDARLLSHAAGLAWCRPHRQARCLVQHPRQASKVFSRTNRRFQCEPKPPPEVSPSSLCLFGGDHPESRTPLSHFSRTHETRVFPSRRDAPMYCPFLHRGSRMTMIDCGSSSFSCIIIGARYAGFHVSTTMPVRFRFVVLVAISCFRFALAPFMLGPRSTLADSSARRAQGWDA